jgi:hypothetical protein
MLAKYGVFQLIILENSHFPPGLLESVLQVVRARLDMV